MDRFYIPEYDDEENVSDEQQRNDLIDMNNEAIKKAKENANIIDLRPLFEWYQATGRKWPENMPIVSTRINNGNKQKGGEGNDR